MATANELFDEVVKLRKLAARCQTAIIHDGTCECSECFEVQDAIVDLLPLCQFCVEQDSDDNGKTSCKECDDSGYNFYAPV